MIPVLSPERWWECPGCGYQHKTTVGGVISPTHPCGDVGGISVPLVQVDTNAGIRPGTVRHRVIEREDYVGAEHGVMTDNRGRAVMALHTERADGSHDTRVYAPTATAIVEGRP